ncbi:MAG: DUF6152 family protein [Gammaproteobacteria bacterium]|jgi:hypothetical protein|nr:hypothetical protein [Gammaproteobacteria bacterium]MCH2670091.1 DUF6152 family protein [Gammaproteobacteria bacterium]|tara:strand:- start:129 stop:521 length:393 start_codon:yes stop_codon:yes gene_type:complete
MISFFKTTTLLLTFSLTSFTNNAFSHHAFAAEFDRDKPISFTGTVTEMKWANPHAWIYVDVENSNGEIINWALETRAANNLIRLGWRPGDLPVGTILQIQGWQARNNTPTASLSAATLPDGRPLFSNSPN